MGLFDFAANIGKKIFGIGDANASEKIKEHIEADNPGINNLTVALDEHDICSLGGECETAEAVTAPKAIANVEFYTIESGDTLWAIASKFLGNGSKYTEIFEANKEVIQDPDLIFPGQKIRIPKAS